MASAAALGFEGLAVGGGVDSMDMLLFVLLIGLFAGGGWAITVLPLVVLGDHGGWLFDPRFAPVVGAMCGVGLLVLEMWIFFDVAPWDSLTAGFDAGSAYLLILSGIVGATTWSVYTSRVRRQARPRARGSG